MVALCKRARFVPCLFVVVQRIAIYVLNMMVTGMIGSSLGSSDWTYLRVCKTPLDGISVLSKIHCSFSFVGYWPAAKKGNALHVKICAFPVVSESFIYCFLAIYFSITSHRTNVPAPGVAHYLSLRITIHVAKSMVRGNQTYFYYIIMS